MTSRETDLAELRQRIVTIEASIASLDKDFAALGGARGDQAAMKKSATIQERINELRCEKALALAAQKKVIQQQQQEQAEAEQAAKRERAAEAACHAHALAAINVRIDQLLESLADLFAQRSNALHLFASTAVADPAFINRLQSKESLAAAACYVNLHQFIALETVASQSHEPLAHANPLLFKVCEDADDS
jgi:hypothetical protein